MDDPSGSAHLPQRPELEPAASPLLSTEPAPPPAPAPRGGARRTLGALAAGAIVVALVWWGVAPRKVPVTLAGGRGSVLEPIKPRADVQTGEQVAPFSGFAVSVDTEPAGAVVTVAGVPRGEAPVLAGIECSPGDKVEIAAEKRGFPVARATTICRADALVKLTVRLRR